MIQLVEIVSAIVALNGGMAINTLASIVLVCEVIRIIIDVAVELSK